MEHFPNDFPNPKPLFSPNEEVWHALKNRWGVVLEYIGGEQRRYYVKHSGWTWSIPEKYLDSARNKITGL